MINLKDTLSNRGQRQKSTHLIVFMWSFGTGKTSPRLQTWVSDCLKEGPGAHGVKGWGIFWGKENVLIFSIVVDTRVHTFVKTCQPSHLKCVNFKACKLYCNKGENVCVCTCSVCIYDVYYMYICSDTYIYMYVCINTYICLHTLSRNFENPIYHLKNRIVV